MSDPSSNEWGPYLSEAIKWALNGINAVVLAIGAWMAKTYYGHIAMLRRHDSALAANDTELGLLRKHREEVSKGVFGTEQNETFRSIDDQLDDLRKMDEALHQRINTMKLDNAKKDGEVSGELKAMNAKIDLVLKAIDRLENRRNGNNGNGGK